MNDLIILIYLYFIIIFLITKIHIHYFKSTSKQCMSLLENLKSPVGIFPPLNTLNSLRGQSIEKHTWEIRLPPHSHMHHHMAQHAYNHYWLTHGDRWEQKKIKKIALSNIRFFANAWTVYICLVSFDVNRFIAPKNMPITSIY